jgi:hypothetical protein
MASLRIQHERNVYFLGFYGRKLFKKEFLSKATEMTQPRKILVMNQDGYVVFGRPDIQLYELCLLLSSNGRRDSVLQILIASSSVGRDETPSVTLSALDLVSIILRRLSQPLRV